MFVAIAVVSRGGDLPGPDELDTVASTDTLLYGCVLVATFLLGVGEVLYDNCAQTLMPAIVRPDQLEKANGRLWAAQEAANQFAGPPLGSLLLAAGLRRAIPRRRRFVPRLGGTDLDDRCSQRRGQTPSPVARGVQELAEGVRWLWRNELLRTMAIILGLFNAAASITFSVYVLFAQEILGASTAEFAAIMMAGAVGAIIGGWTASSLSTSLGPGRSLAVALAGSAAIEVTIGLMSNVPVVAAMNLLAGLLIVLWNVITVSLRQSIVPDHLLGRVNSVYRFLAWGMIPIGAIAGGVIVTVTEQVGDRDLALRMPWFVAGAIEVALLLYATPRLTTERIEAARTVVPSRASSIRT